MANGYMYHMSITGRMSSVFTKDLHEQVPSTRIHFMESRLDLARMLISRLERLSADSVWAHRAAGLRVSLLRMVEQVEIGKINPDRLECLMRTGFEILENAARELPDIK